MRFETVLFDLDGTVVDSGAIILASMRHAAKEVLGEETPDDLLMAAVGGSGLEAQMHALAPDRVEELVTVYRAHNEPLHEQLVCCSGIDDLLVRLKDEGRRLGIVTAKRRATADLAFNVLPLAHLFETAVGGDETKAHKPDPAPLRMACGKLGVDLKTAWMIGDGQYDVEAGNAAGCTTVWISHGRKKAFSAEPSATVRDLHQLTQLLRTCRHT
jgi:pyrophosphatase PpaX